MEIESSTSVTDGVARQVTTNAGAIHWRECGHPSGLPVVFVHGILVNGRLWDKVAQRVATQARVIVPDWPLGAHPAPMNPDADLSVSGMVELMREFLDRTHLDKVVLVGNDSGGALTQLFLARYPERVRAVVLTPCDAYDVWLPAIFKPLELAAFVPGGLWLLSTLMRFRVLRRLPIAFGWLARRMPAELSDRFALPWARSRHIRRDIGKFLRDLGPRHTLAAAKSFPRIDVPVLICWANQDRVFPARLAQSLVRDFPSAKLQWIDDAYTFVPIDQPERLAKAIVDFLHTGCEPTPKTQSVLARQSQPVERKSA